MSTTAARIDRLQQALRDTPLDIVALVPGTNLIYASGAPMDESSRFNLLVVPRDGEPAAVTPALEASAFRSVGISCYTWRDEEGPDEALAALVRNRDLDEAIWGIEFGTMTYGDVERIRAGAPGATMQPADDLLARLRMVKGADEVAALRRAADLTIDALQAGIDGVAPGVTERDVVAEIQLRLFRNGSEGASFNPLVAGGPNSANPHSHPGDRSFRAGDVVIIDCGGVADGYNGDITRCIALAPVPDDVHRMYDVARRAAAAGRAAVRPGVTAESVDRAARQVIEDAGYGEYFIHRTGHGLGLSVHEAPYILTGNDRVLEPGMVFTVEPGIYIPDLGGVRVEDVVVVTDAGCDVLTDFPRELIVHG